MVGERERERERDIVQVASRSDYTIESSPSYALNGTRARAGRALQKCVGINPYKIP